MDRRTLLQTALASPIGAALGLKNKNKEKIRTSEILNNQNEFNASGCYVKVDLDTSGLKDQIGHAIKDSYYKS